MAILRAKVGVVAAADGSYPELRGTRKGALGVQDIGSRFEEACARGVLYSIGCQLTALAAATILLGVTAQPIVGVWNPTTSPVNLVILQAMIQDQINTLTLTNPPGLFVFATSVGNTALTAGLAPFNRKTLSNNGSQAKAFTLSTASLLTGLTNNLVIQEPIDVPLADSFTGTITKTSILFPTVTGIENFDGSVIVPPGGVFAILNTTSCTTHSVGGRLIWEEIPL